jgi:hypothetical protein
MSSIKTARQNALAQKRKTSAVVIYPSGEAG